MTNQIVLKVTFLHRTYSSSHPRKLISSRKSDSSYMYYGKTKKECIEQAKKAFRQGVQWENEWSTEENED